MTDSERKIALWKLLPYRHILKRFDSFTKPVFKCNFTTTIGWRGKIYVSEHQVPEYTSTLRGVDMLDVYHIHILDTITLTENQYNDFKTVSTQCVTFE